MHRPEISRRTLLKIGAALAPALFAKSAFADQLPAMSFKEAPMLADMVKAGTLPPVKDRLPEEPYIVTPYDQIGTYGGTWRRAYKGVGDDRGPQKLMEARIVRFVQHDADHVTLVPTFASHYEVNDASTEFTFHLRKGLKWSDGHPATTDDVSFYFEHVIGKEEIDNWPSTLTADGKRATLKVIDEQSFTITFAKSAPLFLQKLGRDYVWLISPKHYMSQFHPDFVSKDELAKAATKFGAQTWKDLWGRRGKAESFWLNPDLPVLSPWKVTVPPPANTVIFERNPYYYGVDPQGNQLPYIDKISHDLYQDGQTLNLWVAQGRIDLQQRHMLVGDYPFFKENETKGDYTVVTWRSLEVETLWPNQTAQDKVMAGLFQDVRFREAMNVSVDRDTINQVAYAGLATPMQAAPPKGSLITYEPFLTKWVDYDPDRADKLLDDMGLTKRDAKGFRKRPDGKTLEIILSSSLFASQIKVLELVKDNWKDIGIKVTIDVLDRSAYIDRCSANKVMMGHWPMGRAFNLLIDKTGSAYNANLSEAPWATAWGSYNKDPKAPASVAPPKGSLITKVWALLDEAYAAKSLDEAVNRGVEMLKLHAEAPNWIGLVGQSPNLFIKSNRMHNFPGNFIRDDITRDIGIIPTEQLFIKA